MTEQEAKMIVQAIPIKIWELLSPYEHSAMTVLMKSNEKQIAKKPYLDQKGLLDVKMWHCPVCNKEVISDWNRDLANEHCPMCGQKLDWGNEDAE